ncbi:MAG: ATP-binding protein, partial [Streptosporangiaceae bacterium]
VRGDSSRSHATGSTGLGLAIVDAVTAAHGGSVGVTSQPGRTSFAITLPVPEWPSGASPGRAAPPPEHPGPDTDATAARPV